ncbi:MAG: HEAT repeat domain-containing protein, partial [Phormidesmis sp.]
MLGNRFSLTQKVPITVLGRVAVVLLTSWIRATPAQAISEYPPIDNGAYPPFTKVCTSLEIDQFVAAFLRDVNTPNESEGDEYTDEGMPGLITCGEEAVPALVELLEMEDEEIVTSAALALEKIGSEAAGATPTLIKLLEHPTSRVRFRAAWAIAGIGAAAEAAAANLVPLLQDSATDYAAANALAAIGPAARDTIPDLVTAFKAGTASRNDLATALAGIGDEGVLALSHLLDHPDQDIRRITAYELGQARSAVAVPGLIEALADAESEVRFAAIAALGRIGSEAEDAVPALVSILQTREASACSEAAGTIGKIGLRTEVSVPGLVDALQRREDCRRAASIALYSIGEDAIPALMPLLRDVKDEVRFTAAVRLATLGENTTDLADVLLESLDQEVGYEAIRSLGRLGSTADKAVPALLDILQNNDRYWSNAALAVGHIGPSAVPGLIALLDEDDEVVLTRTLFALGQIGPAAQAAVPHLRPLLQSRNEKIQLLAAIALAEVGAEADTVLPILIPALQIDISEVRDTVASAIGSLGAASAAAAPNLIWVIGEGSAYSEDWAMRDSATQALINIGPRAVPSLIKALDHENTVISARSSFALVEIGSVAIPALISVLGDPDLEVRRRAAFVLARIGPEAVPALLAALQDEDANTRKGASYALGIISHPSENLTHSL